jgi:hypothetical protein
MKEDEMISLVDKGEYDREGDMAREQLHTAAEAAKELHDILSSDENNFKIYFEDFYHLCLEYREFDIENIQSFGELFCKYLNELGISEDSYEIDDDWSFIYLKLSQD